MLAEVTTTTLSKKEQPETFAENGSVAKRGERIWQADAEREKFAKRRERSLAFLLFTEWVKETEYKGLITLSLYVQSAEKQRRTSRKKWTTLFPQVRK